MSEAIAAPPVSSDLPPAITPALVAKEALEASELEPGYSAEGIVFFNAAKTLPLTLMVKIDGEKQRVSFNEASVEPSEAAPSASPSGGAVSAEPIHPEPSGPPLDCPFPLPSGHKARLTLNDGKVLEGKIISCEPQKVSIRTGFLYRSFAAGRVVKIELLP